MTGEISYDLVMTDDVDFAEGAYRVEGGGWQVFIVRKRAVAETVVNPSTWDSGATGIVIDLPQTMCLDKTRIERLLAERLGVAGWVEVRGPDSMMLR